MLSSRSASALGGLALLLAGSPLPAAQDPVFRSGTQTVPVYVSVIAPDGRLATDMTREDFEVFDNGRRQAITLFEGGRQPINIIVMLDMSGSMMGNIPMLRNAAVQMFTRLEPNDRARIGSFGDSIAISPTFTNNIDDLIRALWFDMRPGGSTPLWGAANAAMAGLARLTGRRVVLVLSDGKNTGLRGNGGGPTLQDVILRAQTEDFMVYAIGIRSSMGFPGLQNSRRRGSSGGSIPPPAPSGGWGGGATAARPVLSASEPDPGLRELAHESGGGYFELGKNDDLGATFARVADELHQQYLIGFIAPEHDGKLHQLEVRLKTSNYVARTRRSYQAPRGTP
jgi:Ca-activated chloride channel family protein